MQTKLIPIFQIRELCLQKLNPILFQKEYKIIHNSALAAQDYILSGAFKEYNPRMGLSFLDISRYIKNTICRTAQTHLSANPFN